MQNKLKNKLKKKKIILVWVVLLLNNQVRSYKVPMHLLICEMNVSSSIIKELCIKDGHKTLLINAVVVII